MELEQLNSLLGLCSYCLYCTLKDCSKINSDYTDIIAITFLNEKLIITKNTDSFIVNVSFRYTSKIKTFYIFKIEIIYNRLMNFDFYNDVLKELEKTEIEGSRLVVKQMQDPSVKNLYNLNLLSGC